MLSASVVEDTRNLCTSGFSAVCVGKSIVSNRCFFMDLLVVDKPPPPPQPTSSLHLSAGGSNNTTSASESQPPVAKRIHMVGDQVMSSAPRTIEGILAAHGASIETLSLDLIHRYKLAGDNATNTPTTTTVEEEDYVATAIQSFEKLRHKQQDVDAESSSTDAETQPPVNMRLFSLCFAAGGRSSSDDTLADVVDEGAHHTHTTGGSHQLSTPEFIHQVSSLFYTPEEVAECLTQASSVTGETAESRLMRRRPLPRVGDIVRVPPYLRHRSSPHRKHPRYLPLILLLLLAVVVTPR